MKNMKKRAIALSMVLALTVMIMPNGENVRAKSDGVTVKYNFSNNKAGYADGTIKVTSDEKAEYDFYWGDSTGKKLAYNGVSYSELGDCTTQDKDGDNVYEGKYSIISDYTAIPDGAKKLLVYKKNGKVAEYTIPANKVFNGGKSTYSFGILSDIHYNRYEDSGKDDAIYAFDNALNFFDNKGIGFVSVCGDLSANSEESAFKKYKTAISKHSSMTVYSCMGNHDVYNVKAFKKNVNKGITSSDAKSKGIRDVGNTGIDFVYQKNGDIFIYLSQTTWSYNSKTSTLVSTEQLNWLEKNLNKYANKNVYLFFHSYMASENGDVTTAVGNLKNPGGYTYNLTYTYGNADEKRFRKLLNKYANVTMFSGHSHWKYNMQEFNSKLNIGNINSKGSGATLVHISSVTDPRVIGKNDSERTELNNKASEGTLATVYNNCTVYTGVDFWNGKYLAYATYINEEGAKRKPVPTVKVGKVKIKSATKASKKAKKAKIKFRKVSGAVGYQIKYSTTKKFNTKTTKKRYSKKTTYTIKKLKRGKKYYVTVRAYKKQFGFKVYGKWSKAKVVRVKK